MFAPLTTPKPPLALNAQKAISYLSDAGCVLGILDKVKTKSYDEQVRSFIAEL